MAREKKNVEQYFARMQRKLAAEANGPAPHEVEPTPAEEPKAKKQARPSKRTEVEPTPAAPEEHQAKKQARPSKRTSEVQKIAAGLADEQTNPYTSKPYSSRYFSILEKRKKLPVYDFKCLIL